MYLFTVKYGCRNTSPGYCVVKADNGYEAYQRFTENWNNVCSIPITDLVWFRFERWCDSGEVIGMEDSE